MHTTKKHFDAVTARKLINEYGERINIITRENQTLKKQLEDAQTSLKINKEILFSQFSSTLGDKSALLETLKKENTRLTEKIDWLFHEKAESSKLIYKMQQELDDKHRIERELIEKESLKKFTEINKLIEKDNKITFLQKQLDKTKKTETVIFITEPNKLNVEMNTELEATRLLIKKYTSLLQREKSLSASLKDKVNKLEDIIHNSNGKYQIEQQEDNIEVLDCVFSSNDDDDLDDGDEENDDKDHPKDDIQFPNKIQRMKTEQSMSVPKLDLSGVLCKYKKPDNLHIVDGIKKSNRSNNEYIDKLKGQIKIFKSTIVRYKARIQKLKENLTALRNENNALKRNTKVNINTRQVTDANDISMNPNISDKSDQEDDNENDNNIMKRLNKSHNNCNSNSNKIPQISSTEPNTDNKQTNYNNNISFKEDGE